MTNLEDLARTALALNDTMDVDKATSSMTDDCIFVFGNALPIYGRPNIKATLAEFFSSISAVQHEVSEVLVSGDAMTVLTVVHYTRLDGSRLACPAATVCRVRNNKISEWRIYMDASALYAPNTEG